MKAVALAALLVQMSASGGAGAHEEQTAERRDASADDVGKNLSELKSEISSLSEQFRLARERRRQEAERKKRESGEWTNEPTAPAAPAGERAAPAARGSGAPAP
jgi:septal ring factor EnvC (AmiA/AmiB activator)